MSKGQHGNREAKKPKQTRAPVTAPASTPPSRQPVPVAPDRLKRG